MTLLSPYIRNHGKRHAVILTLSENSYKPQKINRHQDSALLTYEANKRAFGGHIPGNQLATAVSPPLMGTLFHQPECALTHTN